MDIIFKDFESLTNTELYHILRIRAEIFVVEQNCIYNDLDNKDQIALHAIAIEAGDIVGCARILPEKTRFDEISIGRVVLSETLRSCGLGKELMLACIRYIENEMSGTRIRISAQCYLDKFYRSLGFKVDSAEYLEDGIPHVEMIR